MMPTEAAYQAKLIKRLQAMLPEAIILKNNPDEVQGIPDLLILWGWTWAMLEVKKSANEPEQPNQAYYVGLMYEMSYAAFICPENEEEVLDELQSTLCSRR
jgi:hypothetical protein